THLPDSDAHVRVGSMPLISSFVIGRYETSSRVMAYEERLQHAAFLGVDLVRAFEDVIASQCFHRRRRRQHATRLTRRLQARGDVDGVAPDVVGELARAYN